MGRVNKDLCISTGNLAVIKFTSEWKRKVDGARKTKNREKESRSWKPVERGHVFFFINVASGWLETKTLMRTVEKQLCFRSSGRSFGMRSDASSFTDTNIARATEENIRSASRNRNKF